VVYFAQRIFKNSTKFFEIDISKKYGFKKVITKLKHEEN